jgi:Domain of unknown function (DUF4082)/Viral BACON domain
MRSWSAGGRSSTRRYAEGYVDRTHNWRLGGFLLLLCAASLTATQARGVAIVGTTSANFTWTAAPGPVAGYAVFVNRNGAGYPTAPNQRVTASQVTVSGSYGDTIVIKVAAYDSSNTLGPFSPESTLYQFVAATQLTLSATTLMGAAVQGQSPANASFSIQSPSGTVSYVLSTGAAWLSVSPASGTASPTSNTITVRMNPAGLGPGTYTSTITATVAGGTGSPATIGVAFTVSAPAPSTPAPSTPAPSTPAPSTPAPSTPVPTVASAFPSTAVPLTADSGPDNAVELGVKFKTDVAGTVTGIRFYKGIGNTGTHVGNLWSSTGQLLASATFSSETASGWQQVNFSTPVSIAANTVYVASYHTNTGHYSDDQNYFATRGVDSPPVHLLQNGVSGVNGVFSYGSASRFPAKGWHSSNYWVDVAFRSGTAPTPLQTSNFTIWPGNAVPLTPDSGPDSAVELGVKFTTDVAGTITGIRFYKGIGNTGTHVGNLWSSTGQLLASATFSSETASGWQQVNFSTPVSIAANTVYVASYHTNTGHYSDDQNYFATTGMDNAPLHALANGVSGSDGVFSYGSGSSFPTQGWNSSNYWVDVVFK